MKSDHARFRLAAWCFASAGQRAVVIFPVMPHATEPSSEGGGNDPLRRMRAYQLATELLSESWPDAEKLRHHQVTEKVSAQLYAAVASITANLGEGYSRSSGRDRARIFEYALGSARESMAWYHAAEPVLDSGLIQKRLDKLEEIRRLLLATIPRERGRLIRPSRRLIAEWVDSPSVA